MGSVNGFLHQNLLLFAISFWVSVSTLFGLLYKKIFRVNYKEHEFTIPNTSNSTEPESEIMKETESDSNFTVREAGEGKESEFDYSGFEDAKENGKLEEEEEEPKFFFKFQYQTYRENFEQIGSDFISNSSSTTATNKYEVLSMKDSSLYLEKPQVLSFKVKELYADSDQVSVANTEIVDQTEMKQNSINRAYQAEETEKKLQPEMTTHVPQFLSEKDFIASDSDSDSSSDSITSSNEVINRFGASTSDSFLSEKDFEEAFDFEFFRGSNKEKSEITEEEEDDDDEDTNLQNLKGGYERDDFEDEDSDILEEVNNLEQEYNMQNLDNKKEVDKKLSHGEEIGCNGKEEAKDKLDNYSEDSNDLEILWEHQELIEQLKMELKKVRATGLPTILEEDESPKIMEDLKPWKIDEKFEHEDRMSELHKFYKSYRERMRKFDILNYQKMYAMGFLQSKDPLKSFSSHKASGPALTSLLSQKFLIGKRKNSNSDPMMNFIRELHGDLEMVYVGQMCLSWEILHWQYDKALEIWDSDPHGIRRYNEVADEFQQFQVLLQRFIENEPFEGPRIQNYVKNRCVLRNLLQVPVIREDSRKNKRTRRKSLDDHDAITSDKLVETMEESIRIFWRFVRADKDAHTITVKGRKGTQIEPQDPAELDLLTEVRTTLQKKEKKLKEVLRSGNCILRKFQKHRREESSSDQVLYFFSQVDMKLVARVLNMSRISTEQLVWCSSKLSKINFVTRKIQVEPSFLLFPC